MAVSTREGGGFVWDTHVLVEGVRSVVGEEPRGDGSYVGLSGRHGIQTTQVDLVRLDRANEVVENGRVKTSSVVESSTQGLEESSGFLRGQLDGPTRVPIVNTVNDVVEILEVVGVTEEGRNEVDLVVSGELVDELGLPAVGGGAGTERAGVSGKGGGEDVAIVLQLVGVGGIGSDVFTERSCVIRGRAWHRAVSQ